MNLDKTTKAELLAMLSGLEAKFNNLRVDTETYMDEVNNLVRQYEIEQDKVKDLKNEIRLLKLQNISDIKGIQTMLAMYGTEAMTHREKAYMAKKLNQVIKIIVDERISELDYDFKHGDELPF